MHLLPEAHETIESVMADIDPSLYPEALRLFPTAFFLSGIGFFAVLIVEETALAWTANKQKRLRQKKKLEEERAATAIDTASTTGTTGVLQQPLLLDGFKSTEHDHSHSHSHGGHSHSHSHGAGDHGHSHSHGASEPEAITTGTDTDRVERADRKLASSLIHGLAPRSFLRTDDSTPPASPEPSRIGRAPRAGPQLGGTDSDAEAEEEDDPIDTSRLTQPSGTGGSGAATSAAAAPSGSGSGGGNASAADTNSALLTSVVASPTYGAANANGDMKSAPPTEPARAIKLPASTAAASAAAVTSSTGSGHAHSHDDAPSDSHSHGHGHGGEDHDHFALDPALASSVVAYILVLALSFHSVFEGIAFGTQDDIGSTVGTCLLAINPTQPNP